MCSKIQVMRFSKTSNVNSFSNFSLPALPMVLRKFSIARFWAKISATFFPHIATSQTLCDHISTIAVRILQSLLHLSEIELMNAHMINQILPLLLLESTRQGIAKHNAMEAVLTRHLRLNSRKLMKSQAQEQVEDIIVDQTVIILPISKDNVKDRRNDYLVRHSSNEPVRQANRRLLSTSEIAKDHKLAPHDPVPPCLKILVSEARAKDRSIHPDAAIPLQHSQTKQIAERSLRNKPFPIFLDHIVWQLHPLPVIVQVKRSELIIGQMPLLRSQTHPHYLRSLVQALKPREPHNLRNSTPIQPSIISHRAITFRPFLQQPPLVVIKNMPISQDQPLIHLLCDHRISSLHRHPFQGTANQGHDASPQHTHTSILPDKSPATKLSETRSQSIKI